MGITPEELRFAAFLIGAAYASTAVAGFSPGWRARRREGRPVREHREVPHLVEAAWVSVQAALIAGVSAAFFTPWVVLSAPYSLLRFSSVPVVATGVAVFVAGAFLAGRAARHLGAELTVAIEVREGGSLVTSGPYARVRHPIYTGIILMVGGLALALASPALAVWLPIAVVCASVRARFEEEMLAADPVRAPEYVQYQARTGRFLPRLGK